MREMEIRGKRVFMRLDFNVPMDLQDGVRVITDANRITEALPTIRYAVEKGAKLILASHLGRPDGKVSPEFSMEPVAKLLAELLGMDVTLADDCVGEGIEMMAQNLAHGGILLLENLRFHAGEEKNEPGFTHALARLGDVYITDAFGTAHRKHASTYGVPLLTPERGMGFLIEKELKFLAPLLSKPERPFFAVLGGSKVSDKIKTLEALSRQVQGLLIGGAMAHAFWKLEGKTLPPSAKAPKDEDVAAAKKVLELVRAKDLPLHLPVDTVDGCDIGLETVKKFQEVLIKAKTVFWNGPLGWFERPEYSVGTFAVARHLAALSCVKVVGGGDTVSAIKLSGVADQFQHLSTGGGAVLEFLEQGSLPGIEVLQVGRKASSTQRIVGGESPQDPA
jgi:phosphoglycerate kinase